MLNHSEASCTIYLILKEPIVCDLLERHISIFNFFSCCKDNSFMYKSFVTNVISNRFFSLQIISLLEDTQSLGSQMPIMCCFSCAKITCGSRYSALELRVHKAEWDLCK